MKPLRWTGKHWRWIVGIYAVLLITSWLYQWLGPSPYNGSDRDRIVSVPAFNNNGPVANHEPITLAYTDAGPRDKPVLILIHGSPGEKSNFDLLAPRLEDDFRVITLDLPGFGGSDKWAPNYSIKSLARYTLALMDELHIEHANVLGFSLGSGVALWMHELAPDRVDSLIFYGGIGIQEGEGSGDYHFEHLKYAVGYAAFTIGFTFIPHFGLLGDTAFHHAWTRNFWDTDQRPLRGILEGLTPDTPLLIIHGRNDPLVPAWTAYQHHEIVRHSELHMLDGSHFMVFFDDRAQRLADIITPFVRKYVNGHLPAERRTFDETAHRPLKQSPLPFGWDLKRGMSPWAQMGIIIVASYILEDPTTVFTGIMVVEGQVDLFVALFAIFIGIFTGDIGLYLIGWVFGRRALAWPPLAKRLPTRHIERLGDWFDRHGWTAVLASRFIPGSRLPLYVSAGALGKKPGRFALWTCIAVMIWAVVMILAVVLLGDAAASPFKRLFGESWVALVAAIIVLLVIIRVLVAMTTFVGRARLKASIARLWRWEFWPLWVFYAPVLPYIAYLSLRHGGFKTVTAVNPGIPHSGFVDESKVDILRHLPEQWTIPTVLVHSVADLCDAMQHRGWSYPLILKPDKGQRGYGLKKVASDADVQEYFAAHPKDVLAQTYHPGPYEAGVFYYRMPDEEAGHIFSITDKEFSVLVGDGKHTVEQLIYRHKRFRMQADTFIHRHGDDRDRVLTDGERFPLGTAGNHCQGTKFLDGSHLITPQLEQVIDEIAQHFDGFYFGRFDVRYRDPEAFKRGEDLHIIELNGVTGESTNIYDPKLTLLNAYRTLYRQWHIAFQIGAMNRRNGVRPTPLHELWRTIRHHYKSRTKANALAD